MKGTFMEPSRRAFLAGVGAVGGLAGLDSHFPAIAAAAKAAKGVATAVAPEIKTIKSGCAICPNFCGIEATVVNGVVRTIYPDPARAEFYNHGICPKGASGMYNMYDPYRLKKPLKRTNAKKGANEDPKWVEISWDEAFSTIAARLQKIKSEDPRKLIWQHGQGKYLIQEQCCKAFTEAFGTPNMVHRTTLCEAARHVADDLVFGSNGIIPDLANAKLLLNFGANYFEGEQTSRWLDYTATMGREKSGLKIIVVEPRLSHAAAKADEWVPVRPGKDVVVLLAMARTMIEAGTIDEPFLVNYTNACDLVGPDGKVLKSPDGKASLVWDTTSGSAKPFTADVKPALKGSYTVDGKSCRTAFQVFADSVQGMTPQAAEEISGVPAATIVRLAQTFAKEARIGETTVIDGQTLRYRPVSIYSFRGLEAKEFGVQNWSAALMLNMMVGAPDAVGGLKLNAPYNTPAYFEASKCEYPPNRADLRNSVYYPHSNHDIAQTAQLVALDPTAYGLKYVPEMQIFYATNRPVASANSWKQFEGLTKTFNVVIDVVMSENAWYADIVLPDKMYLESWHFAPTRGTPMASHTAIRSHRRSLQSRARTHRSSYKKLTSTSTSAVRSSTVRRPRPQPWGRAPTTSRAPSRPSSTNEANNFCVADRESCSAQLDVEARSLRSRTVQRPQANKVLPRPLITTSRRSRILVRKDVRTSTSASRSPLRRSTRGIVPTTSRGDRFSVLHRRAAPCTRTSRTTSNDASPSIGAGPIRPPDSSPSTDDRRGSASQRHITIESAGYGKVKASAKVPFEGTQPSTVALPITRHVRTRPLTAPRASLHRSGASGAGLDIISRNTFNDTEMQAPQHPTIMTSSLVSSTRSAHRLSRLRLGLRRSTTSAPMRRRT